VKLCPCLFTRAHHQSVVHIKADIRDPGPRYSFEQRLGVGASNELQLLD
jgi:hypothetical protein